MKFIGTGNGFYTSYRLFFVKCGHIEFCFLYAYYIYTHFKKKNGSSDISSDTTVMQCI